MHLWFLSTWSLKIYSKLGDYTEHWDSSMAISSRYPILSTYILSQEFVFFWKQTDSCSPANIPAKHESKLTLKNYFLGSLSTMIGCVSIRNPLCSQQNGVGKLQEWRFTWKLYRWLPKVPITPTDGLEFKTSVFLY